MSDALSALLEDPTGARAGSSVFVADNAPDATVEAWGTLVAACTPAETFAVSRLTTFTVTEPPAWDGYPVGVAAVLHFLADLELVDVLIPAPSYPCFLGDGTVDDTYAPIADVIAWVLANGESFIGTPITSYVDGERQTVAPGIAAVYGAAAVIGSGTGLEANFHRYPDGGDITGDSE